MDSNIVMIPLNKLFPHPNNPRKDIGDIGELTESIRTDGIYQNLTVIKGGPGVPEGEEGYTVIIGHRRRAAAEAAGLEEVPCAIAEMDEKKQLSTMLVENMAREDLTVYEQAESFQMMLDLGETQDSIAKMTGFSQATVSRRLKLNKLNKEKFEESQDLNIPLEDYLKLTEIESDKERDQLMDDLGTKDFTWKVNNAIVRQGKEKKQKKLQKILNEMGVQGVGQGANLRWDNKWEKIVFIDFDYLDSEEYDIDLMGEEPKKLKYEMEFSGCGIYRKKKVEKAPPRPQYEIQYEKDRDRIREELMGKYAFAHTQRMTFMGLLPEGKGAAVMLEYIAHRYLMDIYADRSSETAREILDLTKAEWYKKEETLDAWIEDCNVNWPALGALVLMGDKKALHCLNFTTPEYSPEGSGYKTLKEIYDMLSDLGHRMSEEEEQLLDGTHPLFKEYEEVKAKYNESRK